jgi:hypothetical protein
MIHCWKASREVVMNSEGGIFIKRAGPQMRSLDKLSQLGLERRATIDRALIVPLLLQLFSYVVNLRDPPGSGQLKRSL